MLPRVEFKILDLQDNISLVKEFYNDIDSRNNIISFFDLNVNNNIEQEIEEKVLLKYKDNLDKINKCIISYQKLWDKYNDSFFKELANYLNVSVPKNITINAYIGLLTIYPRFLDDYSFCLSIDFTDSFLIETVSHECCHFLWFKKWSELYQDTKPEERESPNIIWQYSEMVVDPILNSMEINKVININCLAYDYFYQMKDKDNYLVMDKLKAIFLENISIEKKIVNGFNYIKLL